MLPTGELLVINVTRTDAQRSYRCRTHHQLTQEAVVSDNVGRIQLTGESIKLSSLDFILIIIHSKQKQIATQLITNSLISAYLR